MTIFMLLLAYLLITTLFVYLGMRAAGTRITGFKVFCTAGLFLLLACLSMILTRSSVALGIIAFTGSSLLLYYIAHRSWKFIISWTVHIALQAAFLTSIILCGGPLTMLFI